MGALLCSTGMSADDPQKSQRCDARVGSKTVMAWQLWHFTDVFSDAQPRSSSGTLFSAASKSCSLISAPSGGAAMGETALQYGQTSACFAGFHCASAPQAGQANLERAVISDMEVVGRWD